MQAYYLDMRKGEVLTFPRSNLELTLLNFTDSLVIIQTNQKEREIVESFRRKMGFKERYKIKLEDMYIHPYSKRKVGGNRLHVKIFLPEGHYYIGKQPASKSEVA